MAQTDDPGLPALMRSSGDIIALNFTTATPNQLTLRLVMAAVAMDNGPAVVDQSSLQTLDLAVAFRLASGAFRYLLSASYELYAGADPADETLYYMRRLGDATLCLQAYPGLCPPQPMFQSEDQLNRMIVFGIPFDSLRGEFLERGLPEQEILDPMKPVFGSNEAILDPFASATLGALRHTDSIPDSAVTPSGPMCGWPARFGSPESPSTKAMPSPGGVASAILAVGLALRMGRRRSPT